MKPVHVCGNVLFFQRIEFHRKETNEALNMVHEHKTKLEELEKKFDGIRVENETLKSTYKQMEERLVNEEERNKQLSNILANKELELNEVKISMLI